MVADILSQVSDDMANIFIVKAKPRIRQMGTLPSRQGLDRNRQATVWPLEMVSGRSHLKGPCLALNQLWKTHHDLPYP